MTDLATAALECAARGTAVFPLVPNEKRPLTPNGYKAATTDTDQVRAWWTRWPDANIGCPTDPAAGGRYWVLDVDDRHDGADALHDLERSYSPLPPTFTVRTRGGQHFYWRWPPDAKPRNRTAVGGARGLDVRGVGGYVVAPPSVRDGRRYEVDDAVPPAVPPAWLVALVAPPATATTGAPAAKPANEWAAVLRAGFAEGTRNAGMTRVVGLLFRRHDAVVARELAYAVNAARCRPPLPVAEVDAILDSIAAAELRKIRGPA